VRCEEGHIQISRKDGNDTVALLSSKALAATHNWQTQHEHNENNSEHNDNFFREKEREKFDRTE